ncbi:MAG TPA: hypothetical protein VGS27_29570 [Candidatus Sulfotelmatobacter sp.]|nr:hypothetical protein [Candidatus Sulfotelmatobacter sp.]
MATLNEVFSKLSVQRRYEVWFLRLGLADGSGAWWFRYLLMNRGREGWVANSPGKPVQIWASWFPVSGKPQSFIQGFPLDQLELSGRGQAPFHFRIGDNAIDEDSCRGVLNVGGHQIAWKLRYQSAFRVTLSSKGWIGFSRTPHSDAVFSGKVTFDGHSFVGDPLGFGVQGHNCGYRHRNFWTWAHAYFPSAGKPATTFEALTYEMPFGLVFRKAVLWHERQQYVFRNLKETPNRESMLWDFRCSTRKGTSLHARIDGRGQSVLRLPYTKTDCSGSFQVANNSLASASVALESASGETEALETANGAVLEVAG